MKPDLETAQALRDAQALREMVNSDGWKIARAMLNEHINVLDSVSSLPSDMSFEEIGKQAMYRSHAISLVRTWLDTIEGRIDQGNQQRSAIAAVADDNIFRMYSASAK